MSLTAAVWPQFATQVFRGGIGRLTCIGSYANKQVTTFTFRAQATTCSKHNTRTVMDAGCECAPWVRSANHSDSWALVCPVSQWWKIRKSGPVTYDLEILWMSGGCEDTYSCKISFRYVQRFVSYPQWSRFRTTVGFDRKYLWKGSRNR